VAGSVPVLHPEAQTVDEMLEGWRNQQLCGDLDHGTIVGALPSGLEVNSAESDSAVRYRHGESRAHMGSEFVAGLSWHRLIAARAHPAANSIVRGRPRVAGRRVILVAMRSFRSCRFLRARALGWRRLRRGRRRRRR
jgi:hypothetical protein